MGKRFTPEEDVNRLAERVFRDSGQNIQDKEMFDLAFNDYMSDIDMSEKQDTVLRKKVFDKMRSSHPEISSQSFFKKAGGKSFVKDRERTAKRVVTDIKVYKKRGARKVDLQGYDTKKGRIVKLKRQVKVRFDIPGRVKERIVYVRRVVVVVQQKEILRYRDKLGRFASVRRR